MATIRTTLFMSYFGSDRVVLGYGVRGGLAMVHDMAVVFDCEVDACLDDRSPAGGAVESDPNGGGSLLLVARGLGMGDDEGASDTFESALHTTVQ